MKAGRSGVTSRTPKSILFGAGTVHKNLKYENGKWNFEESVIGASSGGSSFKITPEITKIDIDGVWVKVKGLSEVKTGENAELSVKLIEINKDFVKGSVVGKDGTSDDPNYDLIESKPDIEEGDYFENIAFVGTTLDARNIIVILDNALCTSGLEGGGEDKKGNAYEYTFSCYADLDSDHDTLPYHIYFPKES